MTNLELDVLIGYIEKILYFCSKHIKTESPSIVALLTKLILAIKPIKQELDRMKNA